MQYNPARRTPANALASRILRDYRINKSLYLMVLPVIAYYVLFHYKPMYGAVIAFKEFNPRQGIWGSPWVGFDHFVSFFKSRYFTRVVGNTININIHSLLFGFPAPILLALLFNELRGKVFVRIVQTATYLPHFISLVVICGMIREFVSSRGIITDLLVSFGLARKNLLDIPSLFVPIYIISDIWQGVGWGSILYLSALSCIDPELYEAATTDGAGRLRQTFHITLPGILPTVSIMLILRIGGMLSLGFEKIVLLYNPVNWEVSDVISSFVYRKGLQEFNFGYSSAVGLFNSVINFFLLVTANFLSRKINETSLW